MKQPALVIGMETNEGFRNLTYPIGHEFKVAVYISTDAKRKIKYLREIQFHIHTKGIRFLHWEWTFTDEEQAVYRRDTSSNGRVVRAVALARQPNRRLRHLHPQWHRIAYVHCKVKGAGFLSVVGKPISKRNPYSRDRGIRISTGFLTDIQVWDYNPRHSPEIVAEPLEIEVG